MTDIMLGLMSGIKNDDILFNVIFVRCSTLHAHIAFDNNEEMEGGQNRSRTHRDFLFYKPTINVTYRNGFTKTLIRNGEFDF